jgi:hypothetical protein
MVFLGLAHAIISISPSPGGPGRTKIAPTGVALLSARMRLGPIGGYPSCPHIERLRGGTWLKGMMVFSATPCWPPLLPTRA